MEAVATSPSRKITRLGIAGLVVAFLALAAAVLSPWVIDALEPDRPPIDEVAADVAVRIKDRIVAKAKGQTYATPANPERAGWAKAYPVGVIAAGFLAVVVGVIGLVAHHHRRLNTATVAVGTSAIVFQYALLIAAALLLILLIGLIFSSIGDAV